MTILLLYAAMLAAEDTPAEREQRITKLLSEIAQSGSVLEVGEREERLADARRRIAPGAPPLLSFRYFQGMERGRFGNLDLMLDDAGH